MTKNQNIDVLPSMKNGASGAYHHIILGFRVADSQIVPFGEGGATRKSYTLPFLDYIRYDVGQFRRMSRKPHASRYFVDFLLHTPPLGPWQAHPKNLGWETVSSLRTTTHNEAKTHQQLAVPVSTPRKHQVYLVEKILFGLPPAVVNFDTG